MAEDNHLMKKIEMDGVTKSYLERTLSVLLPTDHIVVTGHHKKVFEIIKKNQYFRRKGIYISGPPGSGKSTTCVYLYEVLKEENIPFVVFSTGSLDPSNKRVLQQYLCEGVQGDTDSQQAISLTTARDSTPEDIIEEFICTRFKDENRVIFFDVSSLLKSEFSCHLLDLALVASSCHWVVVLAVSSGAGWTIGSTTTDERKMNEDLLKMRKQFVPIESQNFTENEAVVYTRYYKIDVDQLDENSIEVNNNPRLLYCFADTHETKLSVCKACYRQHMRKLVSDLLEVMRRREFSLSLKNCMTWLENARHGVHIPISRLDKFEESYLCSENLAYHELCEDGRKFKIMLYIPDVYDYLVNELRSSHWDPDIRSIPVVRGLIFEKEFLSSPELENTPLTVVALTVVAVGKSKSHVFHLPPLCPGQGSQLRGNLKTKLQHRQIYHLRPSHPAIDAVAFIDGGEENFSLDHTTVSYKCLFLLQLSVSTYKDHESKGNDIKKVMPLSKEGRCSVAKYYQDLCEGTVDMVIYVFMSPKETSTYPLSPTIFNHELNVRSTRSGMSSETTETQFFYGFLQKDSRGAKLMDEINNSIV